MSFSGNVLSFLLLFLPSTTSDKFPDDICNQINGQRIYLDFGEFGTLEAKYDNNMIDRFFRRSSLKRCTVEFISCPSCIVSVKFKFLNLSKCGGSTVFDSCGCDYVWIYEPTFEQSSQQFCGRFISSNLSVLEYKSQTRKLVVEFLYHRDYEHAFVLDYTAKRNRIVSSGFPKFGSTNSTTQTITSPFFPNLYPTDLTMEHVIACQLTNETCRISLIFTDFLVAPSSIMDFFDWNNERIFVTTGNLFRPPVITTSGPSLVIRFYANGATNLGFKAHYSFILGHVSEPNIDCGGRVNNLGGGITMMKMISEGLKSFDCIWMIKPPETYLHMKSHLYVKVVNFSGFAGSSELVIRQGLTSTGPIVENLRLSLAREGREHVVPISQGFYVRFKGLFRSESRLVLVYAAFNNKQCLAGSDFPCHNGRCVSVLLNCDGFDHCGDNSDESTEDCSKDPRDRRAWSKTSHFIFPKVDGLSTLATSTAIFLLCSFGLMGFIFAILILLYRINIKTRHQRHIQNHIETINAILEEGVGVVEEEIIIPDDPPDYEPPPDYNDVIVNFSGHGIPFSKNKLADSRKISVEGTSRSCQTTPIRIPDSPPPAYQYRCSGCCNQSVSADSPLGKFCENVLSTAGHLMYSRCKKSNCFSDFELARISCTRTFREFNLKKSFTTGDMNLWF